MFNRSFTPFPYLTTKRLTLRQLEVSDEQAIFTLRSDRTVNKYLNRQPSKTIEDARDFINTVNENIDKNENLYWAITLRDKNILVGTICIFGFSDDNNTCEIGYELLTDFQGQGMMQEAVEKVIDYAFNAIKIKKIEAFLHKDNQRSIKLLEKFTFTHSKERVESNPDLLCYQLKNSMANFR